MEDKVDIEKQTEPTYTPSVSFIALKVGTHTGTLQTFAEIQPRFKASIKSHVMSDVVMLSPKALAGEQVKKGEILAKFDDYAYRAKLAEAQQLQAEAHINLLQAKSTAKLAKEDWKLAKLDFKPSDLAMQKPQLELAKAKLKAATALVNVAKKELNHTQVKAPFSGIITKRLINQGQKVAIDDDLFHILDQKKLDITASLSPKQWNNLPQNWLGTTATIKNDNQEVIAEASIKRGGGFLDPETRLYKIFLEIENPHRQDILAGEFVYVELQGKTVPQTLLIPASAYTQEGVVWYIDKQNQLRFFDSDVLFYQADHLIVTAPTEFDDKAILNIVTTPLVSFIAGRKVTPVNKSEVD